VIQGEGNGEGKWDAADRKGIAAISIFHASTPGTRTTTNLIGNGLVALSRFPAPRKEEAADRTARP